MPWELMIATVAGWVVALIAIVIAVAIWSRALSLEHQLDQERQKHGRTWESAARLRAQIDEVAKRIS